MRSSLKARAVPCRAPGHDVCTTQQSAISFSLPWLHPERAEKLNAALRERILIIDGAMGTMIQRRDLQEPDYRGTRFAGGYDSAQVHVHGPGCDHAHAPEGHDLKSNNDLLLLSRAESIAGIHRAYLDAGATCWKPIPAMRPRWARPTITWNIWCTN